MKVKEVLGVMPKDQIAWICVGNEDFVEPVEYTSGQRTNTAYGDYRVCELYEYDGDIRIVFHREKR